jgi:hypothetical protein
MGRLALIRAAMARQRAKKRVAKLHLVRGMAKLRSAKRQARAARVHFAIAKARFAR